MDVVMRPHFPSPPVVHRSAAASESERSLAEAWLGAEHPLVDALDRFEVACRQLFSVTAVQGGAAFLVFGGWRIGVSIMLAAGAVQVVLCCRVGAVRAARRDLCRELIIAGGGGLPLPSVSDLSRRLLDIRTRARLARSIDDVVRAAVRPRMFPGEPRPLPDARVIRAAAPELRQVASLLRDRPDVRGVALVEWLLSSPATPLYGFELEPLRRELWRARYLLAQEAQGCQAVTGAGRPPTGSPA
jgi:hypothetical protein